MVDNIFLLLPHIENDATVQVDVSVNTSSNVDAVKGANYTHLRLTTFKNFFQLLGPLPLNRGDLFYVKKYIAKDQLN